MFPNSNCQLVDENDASEQPFNMGTSLNKKKSRVILSSTRSQIIGKTSPLVETIPSYLRSSPTAGSEGMYRSMYEEEVVKRRRIESELESATKRADEFQAKAQKYKDRLREAASAYDALKVAYKRLHFAYTRDQTFIKDGMQCVQVSVTETMLPSKPASPQVSGRQDESQMDDKTLVIKRDHQSFDRQYTNRNAFDLKKDDEGKKRMWKKAVRQGIAEEDFESSKYQSGAPKGSTNAQSVHTSNPMYTKKIKREKENGVYVNNESDAKQSTPIPYQAPKEIKYRQVIRKKDQREKLPGFECPDCRRFYDALESWGAVALGGIPPCRHHDNNANNDNDKYNGNQRFPVDGLNRLDVRDFASRHRYVHEPPPTPNDFWDLQMSP